MANQNQNNNQQQKASPKNLNIVTLEGRLAADANLKPAQESGNGVSHCYFRLAVNEGYLRSDGTNAVSFIPCNIGGKRAESIAPYLKQGMRLTVTGSISVRSNKLADGQYSDSCMLSVDQVFFGPQAQQKDQSQASTPAPQPQYQQAPATPAPQPQYQQPAQQGNPFAGTPAPQPQYQQAPTTPAPQPQYQQPTQQGNPFAGTPAPQPQYQQQAPATPAPQPQYQQPVQDNPFAGAPAQGFDFNNNPFADGAMNPPMFQ